MDNIFTSISRDSKYRKANVDYLIKKLRAEFDKIGAVRPPCKHSQNVQLDVKRLKKYWRLPNGVTGKKSKKRKFPSYTQMRREREEFRKTIAAAILAKNDEDDEDNDGTFPNSKERQLLRYYQYIAHGIDACHIAPISKKILKRILHLVPKQSLKWNEIIDTNIDQIKTEYIFTAKKAVVDYVLGKSIDLSNETTEMIPNRVTHETKMIGKLYGHKIHENRKRINRNLYAISSCQRQMLSIWQTTYSKINFIDVDELFNHSGTFDLADFIMTVNKHISKARKILSTKWYEALRSLLCAAAKKKLIPDETKPISLNRFYDCVASQMTQCLQDVAVRSLQKFTIFLKNKSYPQIKLHILLEDGDRLVFSPTFSKIHNEVLHVVESVSGAVQNFKRVEMTMQTISELSMRNQFLCPIIPANVIDECRQTIIDFLEEERIVPELLLHDFDDYIDLMNGVMADDVYNFMEKDPEFEEYCDLINHYSDIEYEISMNVWGIISVGFYEFHRTSLIQTLESLAKFMQTEISTKMISDQQSVMVKLQQEYEEISKKALTIPLNTHELMVSKEYVQNMQTEVIPEMETRLRTNLDHFLWLMDQTVYTPLEIKQNSMTFQWYLKMPSVFHENLQIVEQKTVEYQELLRKRIEQFRRDLDIYWDQLMDYENWGDITFVAKYKRKASILDARLTAASEKIVQINEEETSFGWPLSEYPLRKQTHDKLLPYKRLFDAGQDFIEKRDQWLKSQVGSYDPINIANNIEETYNDLLKLNQGFEDHSQSRRLADDIKTIIDDFKMNMPIIQNLGNPGLKTRHWEQISEMVGFPITVSAELTLEKIIEFGLEDFLPRFEKISESATKENSLELAMSNMIVEWQGVNFIINEYPDAATYLLDSINDIQILLDDHIIKTQTMKNSPYIKPFETEILAWEAKLVSLQEILDDWLHVQAHWMYLEPIFTSPDIQQQMPEEGRRFGAVDKIWKELMKQAHSDPAVMSVIEIDKMSEKLKKASSLLEIIQKGLNTYLETKRLCFPRFFFLSNDCLLEVLAETKDPLKIQPYLKKCFCGINSLEFNESVEITTLKSSMGEEIELCKAISTVNVKGQIEKWLLELERIMKQTISIEILSVYEKLYTQNFDEWVLRSPGQMVHATFQIKFTKDIDDALSNPEYSSANLKACGLDLGSKIDNTTSLLSGNITSAVCNNLRALLLSLIQAKCILDRLIERGVNSINDFEWLSQMRFYFNEQSIDIKMLISNRSYGFEYIGNKSQLVLTPLTNRYYRTVFLALNNNFGLAIQGSTGAGKSELIKNLAEALAIYFVLFSCSFDLDYKVIGDFFKGVIACGSWICFDGFNMVHENVMSVVAGQIKTIQEAVTSSQQNINFEDVNLTVDTNFGIFLTLTSTDTVNCHSMLHENLKSLFRPVTMMQPDLEYIAYVELLCFGFKNAKTLGKKIVTTLNLCREQIMPQHHHHFGSRAAKSILKSCDHLKIECPQLQEEQIVVATFRNIFSSLFNDLESSILESILGEIFSEYSKNTESLASMKLKEALSDACTALNIVKNQYFEEKICQLYEIIKIRSGVMIIGDPFSGKSTIRKVLAEALSILESKNLFNERRVISTIINPKSMTLQQLYGEFEPTSQDWHDGILTKNFKQFSNCKDSYRKWLIFDGPIETVWMENLKSVLDDNRKLCLTSGGIVRLTDTMNLFFESLDLKFASPSIISCCGIVCMSAASMGWEPLFQAWLINISKQIEILNDFDTSSLFMRFCPILLYFIKNSNSQQLLSTSDSNLIKSLINLFECMLFEYFSENPSPPLNELDVRSQIEGIFFFSCIWSFGATLNETGRVTFSELFHGLLSKDFPQEFYAKFNIGTAIKVPNLQKSYIFTIPKSGTVFDYRFICEGKGKWKLWSDEIVSAPPLSRDIPVNQIIIVTEETIRIHALLDLLIRHGKTALIVGPTSTGKTIYVCDYLHKKLDQSTYTWTHANFTSETVANQVQDVIMDRLDKRRKGVFGPPLGKRCIIFVDDLSMPKQEDNSDSQSSVELLRTYIDHKTWYDHKNHVPIKLIDLQIMCAMQPPHIIDRYVSSRFLSHFNVLAIDEFTNDVLRSIFSKIVLWHLDARGFSKEFDPCIDEVVLGTLSIYTAVRETLLPVPNKSHYVFNVRDFSRVIQGVLLSVPETTEGIDAMRRLWVHEIHRVYGDRLVGETDQKWLLKSICEVVEAKLHTTPRELFSRFIGATEETTPDAMRKLMFCDFTNPKADTRSYLEVQDLEELRYVVESYLVEFNNMTKRPMNLTMFRYAVEHLSRVCRVLKQPRSNALLIGIGGSGRQSYTRIAAHIMDYELFQVELTRNYSLKEWTEFLKEMLLKVSSTESHGVFLFSDGQVKFKQFLNDISNLLQSGEIIRLFNSDERKEICEKMLVIDKQRDKSLQTDGTPRALYNLFISVIREQLHIILCLSPINENFRNYIRDFPAFINSCTIDWLHPWPNDALSSIAQRFLAENLEFLSEPEQLNITKMFMEFYSGTMALMKEVSFRENRRIFIPPKTYIDSINIFKEKLLIRKTELTDKEKKYNVGIKQIIESEAQVTVMQKSIETLEPECKITAEKLTKQISDVQASQELVDDQMELVKKDEAQVSEITSQVNDLSEHVKNIMEDALPYIIDAEKALTSLTTADLTAIRTMKSPPVPVKIIMETICILRDINKDKPNATTDEYWGISKKMLNDPKFIENLLKFERDSIPDVISEKLQTKMSTSDAFDVDKIKLISIACEALCKWVNAIAKYDRAMKISLPKRMELKDVEKVRDAAAGQLNAKAEQLKILKDNLAILQNQLKIEKDKSESVKAEYERCCKRLQRAIEILSSLGGEKDNWKHSLEAIQKESRTLVGDILISSGITAYLGQFTEQYRVGIIKTWTEKCISFGLCCNNEFAIENVFANSTQIQTWNILGLPNDPYSIESAVILRNSRRWTLVIDPQSYASNWIKNLEKENRLCVIQLSQPDYLRVLENAIQYGLPVLVEDVGTELDPIMESVLMKEVFRQSGSRYIKLGENAVEYNDTFRLYLTTKLDKPNYSAEVAAKVGILNFKITYTGMISYLLGVAVARERPDVEAEKSQTNVIKVDTNRNMMSEENKILHTLFTEQNLLESDTAVQLISSSKIQSNELLEKLNVVTATEHQIDATRMAYKPLATHASIIYFTIDELVDINCMYQYSLTWFIDHLTAAIDNTDKVDDVGQRINDLKKYFTFSIFRKICFGLRNEEHILLSVLISKNLSIAEQTITESEWDRFIENIEAMKLEENDKKPNWMPASSWAAFNHLSQHNQFSNVVQSFFDKEDEWQNYFMQTKSKELDLFADFYKMNLTIFQKLLLFRCAHPTKLDIAFRSFVECVLGDEYIATQPFDMQSIFAESTCCKPLLFILTSKYDPIRNIRQLADANSISKSRLKLLSMGQRQNNLVMQSIESAMKSGDWIILQNCHLAAEWLFVLERICNNLAPDTTNPDFRLWLTSKTISTFPLSILRRSIKLINEPPFQLRGTILNTFQDNGYEKWMKKSPKSIEMRKIIFSLSFFHAAVIERRNFSAFGWHSPYDFNEIDLRISIEQICEILNRFEDIPLPTLKLILAEDIYGGHIGDSIDLRCLATLSKHFCTQTAEQCGVIGSDDNKLYFPKDYSDMDTVMAHIENLRERTDGQAYNLHPNANLLKEKNETNYILSSILFDKEVSHSGACEYDEAAIMSEEIVQNLPKELDIRIMEEKHSITESSDCLNTVLHQEVFQYNQLLICIRTTLTQIINATKGCIVFSHDIETVVKAISKLKIPTVWLMNSYPSLSSIGGFIKDLQHRIQFLKEWLENGTPQIYWLPVFYSAQSFLTAISINYSRQNGVTYNQLDFDYIIKAGSTDACPDCASKTGYCIDGLYLNGAAWCFTENYLIEQKKNIFFDKMPAIHLKPFDTQREKTPRRDEIEYQCPIYKTLERSGYISINGENKNFITSIYLKCSTKNSPEHWVLRDCVLICQINGQP